LNRGKLVANKWEMMPGIRVKKKRGDLKGIFFKKEKAFRGGEESPTPKAPCKLVAKPGWCLMARPRIEIQGAWGGA